MEGMEKRRNDIVRYVNEQGNVTFNQLKEHFPSVSDMTLRTDLKALDEQQKLVRIHGGAKSLEIVTGNDDVLKKRYIRNTEEKKIIARKALELVKPNQTIFIDSGSTTTMLSNVLKDQPCTIFTNSISCAVELSRLKQAHCMLAGGTINVNSLSVTGVDAVQFLEHVNFDTVFMGVTCFSRNSGFTCESYQDAQVKRIAIQNARKVVILMDSSKIDKDGSYQFCSMKEADIIVSDFHLPESFKEECESMGVTIL
ncbi:DeoR/GlpR family DNA-binding transcription regulator [Faecalicoccus pleomorphus]|uniref:DeoR/GlpR family DNA-binding transcription regulator n=1 Tax=Faecalicoccus pleomorphus TaxID=1323 RepID=UPI001F0CE4C8|nr:DeoR/GlpR family DNA-binding transcription regulator [Faecalicoccus pleomorphus]